MQTVCPPPEKNTMPTLTATSKAARLLAPTVGVMGFGLVYAPSDEPIKVLVLQNVAHPARRPLDRLLGAVGMTVQQDDGAERHIKPGVGQMPKLM